MKNCTDISFILDRSGSMQSCREATISGFNNFLSEQKKLPGEALINIYQFDDQYDTVYSGKPIAGAQELTAATFVPRGSTALLDAIGRTISTTGARLAAIPDAQRPDKIIIVIVTDGGENASHEFTKQQVFDLISHQRDKYQWQFVFLGANQDAISVGSGFGIAAGSSMTYAANSAGTNAAYQSLNASIANVRSGVSASTSFSEKDRDDQKKAGAV